MIILIPQQILKTVTARLFKGDLQSIVEKVKSDTPYKAVEQFKVAGTQYMILLTRTVKDRHFRKCRPSLLMWQKQSGLLQKQAAVFGDMVAIELPQQRHRPSLYWVRRL